MRVRSLHPGVALEEVRDATGFDLVVDDELTTSREPTTSELALLDKVVDPEGRRHTEVPDR